MMARQDPSSMIMPWVQQRKPDDTASTTTGIRDNATGSTTKAGRRIRQERYEFDDNTAGWDATQRRKPDKADSTTMT